MAEDANETKSAVDPASQGGFLVAPSEEEKALHDRQLRAAKKLRKRREAAVARADTASSGILKDGKWESFASPGIAEHYAGLDDRAGLAFSGGGIRSATIALGLSEALASRGRLYAFDMISTVSGGGYFGSFLRALHIIRGSVEHERKLVSDRAAFAEATMASLPDQQYFRGKPGRSSFIAEGQSIKNPLWWLRENGRYLAPSGMTDYGFALVYMVRAWVSLVVFALSIAMILLGSLQLLLVGLVYKLHWLERWMPDLAQSHLYSPLFPVVILMIWAGIGIAGAYWYSTARPYSRVPSKGSTTKSLVLAVLSVVLIAALLIAILEGRARGEFANDSTAKAWTYGLVVALAASLVSAGYTALTTLGGSNVDFRRVQTRVLANFSLVLVALLALTAIDWTALTLRHFLEAPGSGSETAGIFKTSAVSGALASVISFLIAKVPDWFSSSESALGKFLVANARHFALMAALAILASIAILADLLVIKLLWQNDAWAAAGDIRWKTFALILGLIGFFGLLFARSLNFANLLALTPLYGSRLTRTFMGGSNVHRLDATYRSEVTQGLADDDIALQDYMEMDCAAPLHFINVTRNRTIGEKVEQDRIDVAHDDPLVGESFDDPRGRLACYESALTLHDRHGDRMVFGPFGMRVGAEFYDWDDMDEPPSLGLLCAISGAAVGAGMGRMTTLGSSMAFTLANLRLGYWWKEQFQIGTKARFRGLATLLPGLSCLSRELLGRFGTKGYWFLSDGGHSENTGVLTLLERGCRFILASDNGQDVDFTFCDLEILIRTARTDIGMEVEVVSPAKFPNHLDQIKDCFINSAPGDWRENARAKDHPGFALLLRATDIPRRVNGVWKRRRGAYIVWLKPSCFANLPADIAAYAQLNPDFPQQSTGNQFFDEAQWESYRRLGFEMGRRLFAKREPMDSFLPVIVPASP